MYAVYIGNDIVYIPRFYSWVNYSESKLLKVFTAQELAQCRKRAVASQQRRLCVAQYLAARFAAKEAVYKACCFAGVINQSLYSFLKTCSVTNDIEGRPQVFFENAGFSVQVSISHDRDYVMAVALLTQKEDK